MRSCFHVNGESFLNEGVPMARVCMVFQEIYCVTDTTWMAFLLKSHVICDTAPFSLKYI